MALLPRIGRRKSSDIAVVVDRNQQLRQEAQIGGQLFGPVPQGHNRQFFCLDEHTWVWHEEWNDNQGIHRVLTTRYEVRPGGVLKIQDGQTYQAISADEARNLLDAAKLYVERVSLHLYGTAITL